MVHKLVNSSENIPKLPTPTTISPYLQAFRHFNKPLNPLHVLHLYMPTHANGLYLSPTIQDQIRIPTMHHCLHKYWKIRLDVLKPIT